MDLIRFDSLARGWSRAAHPGPTRRTLMATLAAAVLAVGGRARPGRRGQAPKETL